VFRQSSHAPGKEVFGGLFDHKLVSEAYIPALAICSESFPAYSALDVPYVVSGKTEGLFSGELVRF